MAQLPPTGNSPLPPRPPTTWEDKIGILSLLLGVLVLASVVIVLLRPAPPAPPPANPMQVITRPAAVTQPRPAATQPQTPPAEAQVRRPAPAATTAPADADALATDAPQRGPAKPTGFLVPAGRSPIPQEGEDSLTQALAFERTATSPASERQRRRASSAATKPAEPQTSAGTVSWQDAPKHLGKTVTVEGPIVATRNTGAVCFLNFDRNWRDNFYLVLVDNAFRHNWPSAPEQHFLNKQIAVTGEVRLHQNRPQIRVSDPSQIKILGPAKVESIAIPDDADTTP